MTSHNPRFAILNTVDAPIRKLIAQWIDGIGYCYMYRAIDKNFKRYDGTYTDQPTAIEDFGFDVYVGAKEVFFRRNRESIATYENGELRQWQDTEFKTDFTLPLIVVSLWDVRGAKWKIHEYQ